MGLKSSKQSKHKAAVLNRDQDTELQHLFLSPDAAIASDAPFPPSPPTVLCFHGSGHGTHQDTWLAVIQGVAAFAPILYYDRRGIGHNEAINNTFTGANQTPEDAVRDLQYLLRTLGLQSPYILIAHSYGGTIARTFLQLCSNQVAGMVLAETGQETPTPYDEEQYQRRILGRKPVSVIHAVPGAPNSMKDDEDSGDGRVIGGESFNRTTAGAENEETRKMRQMWLAEDERLKKAQLRLSSNARYVRVDGCGHDVVSQRPDVVIEEVRWVLEDVLQGSSAEGERSRFGTEGRSARRWLSRN